MGVEEVDDLNWVFPQVQEGEVGRVGTTVEKVGGGLIRLFAVGTGRGDGGVDPILVAPQPTTVGGPEL